MCQTPHASIVDAALSRKTAIALAVLSVGVVVSAFALRGANWNATAIFFGAILPPVIGGIVSSGRRPVLSTERGPDGFVNAWFALFDSQWLPGAWAGAAVAVVGACLVALLRLTTAPDHDWTVLLIAILCIHTLFITATGLAAQASANRFRGGKRWLGLCYGAFGGGAVGGLIYGGLNALRLGIAILLPFHHDGDEPSVDEVLIAMALIAGVGGLLGAWWGGLLVAVLPTTKASSDSSPRQL